VIRTRIEIRQKVARAITWSRFDFDNKNNRDCRVMKGATQGAAVDRPHLGKDNLLLNPPPAKQARNGLKPVPPPATISLAEVRREKQLGGLLKHYYRKAA
jgi:hypothetical protein